jgi:hypothetical protein
VYQGTCAYLKASDPCLSLGGFVLVKYHVEKQAVSIATPAKGDLVMRQRGKVVHGFLG